MIETKTDYEMTKDGFYIGDADELAELNKGHLPLKKQKKRRRDDSCSEEEVLEGITTDSISGYLHISKTQKVMVQHTQLGSSIKHRQLQFHDNQGLNNRVGNNLKKSE